ncbi:DDI1 [[Candida] subhashii]|uniref:DDI1 n=1 Tax=[Candida] subhashii TaxID=561895 RepID=A0A8J5QKF3_9ASCO|nr:DDI1 [[Candida] subhashii]KAG7662190.1 DDI1 [[Candida] subhashii]
MLLTISLEFTGDIISVDVPESLSLEDFKAYLQAETGIEPNDQTLRFDGKILTTNQSLTELGLKEGELLLLTKKQHQQQPAPQQQQPQAGSSSAMDPNNPEAIANQRIELMRQQFLNDPSLNEQIRLTQPDFHRALSNPTEFRNLVIQQANENFSQQQKTQDEIRRLQEDPDDPENQARILELIRQEQIEENMKLAWEVTPESFTTVTMLYIKLKINGVEVVALVDSGANNSTISHELAEKTGISRLIDKRFQGKAIGVGSQEIGGKIHSVPINIGDSDIDLPSSFLVVDTSVGILFGLDMLRRHTTY